MTMNPKKYPEAIWLKNRTPEIIEYNESYRNKHPEFEKFDMPEYFWYKIYQEFQVVHWAVIRQFNINKVAIYFINVNGRAFDRLILEDEREAEKLLVKSRFISNKKKKAPYLPIQPIFVSLIKSKKKALYSKAGWLNCKIIKNAKIKNIYEILADFISYFTNLQKVYSCIFKVFIVIFVFLFITFCLFIGFKLC